MPYHVPKNQTWRARDVAAALERLGIECVVDNEQVSAVVPIVELLKADEIAAATTLDELTPKKIGESKVTIGFDHEVAIDNIFVQYDIEQLLRGDGHLNYTLLRAAFEECGYVSGSHRDIVQLYLPNDESAMATIARIDSLQIQKEELVVSQDFAAAKAIQTEQAGLRQSLDERIKNLTS